MGALLLRAGRERNGRKGIGKERQREGEGRRKVEKRREGK